MSLRIALLIAVSISFFAKLSMADRPVNVLSESEELSGWELLFDGQSTSGWRNYQKETISDGWKVENGELRRTDKGAGDIITEKTYENFELFLDYRISKEGNSGLMFLVTEEGQKPWHSAPEIQIQDNVDGHDPQKAGWLYQLYTPEKKGWVLNAEKNYAGSTKLDPNIDTTRPAGEWNTIYLRLQNKQGEVMLNGQSYYTFNVGSDDWNARVAKSKFAAHAGFAKAVAGHLCLQDHGDEVAFRNIKIRQLSNSEPQNPSVGELPFKAIPAFPHINWDGWEGVDERGRVQELRPIIVTHANDGSGRLFSADQSDMIHVFNRSPETTSSTMFLDWRNKTAPWKKNNEEGFLGLAFHPKFKENGQFFIYYTSSEDPQTSVISRMAVSEHPDRANPEREDVILKINQPFANHNGGSIAFGPDGYLYIGMGDGGSSDDPLSNGQNLGTMLGKILRIDVDQQENGNNYAIPQDNPFINTQGALPEIYAFGFRNIWRLSFDRQAGDLWVSDVGQNLWEEINIVTKGGNYGWSVAEGTYPFGGPETSTSTPIDPVWEYDHQVGKSITGGLLYRGIQLPELQGAYVYADYVTGKLWALKYDAATHTATNWSIPSDKLPVLSFGEGADGEIYFTVGSVSGQSILTLAPQ